MEDGMLRVTQKTGSVRDTVVELHNQPQNPFSLYFLSINNKGFILFAFKNIPSNA